MTEPGTPLQPIAEAFRRAGLVKGGQDARATSDEFAELAEDERSIERAAKKGGKRQALAVGKALGWDKADIEALLVRLAERSAGAPSPSMAGAAADGAGGGHVTPPPADPSDEERFFKKTPRPIKPLPDTCPVIPLGVSDGAYFYLTPNRELFALSKHSADDIRRLFGHRQDFLWDFWPKHSAQTGEQTGWKADRMAESLIHACASRGIFDPTRRLRGVGAWKDEAGGLVLHAGDGVYMGGEWREPGYHGEHVYPGYDRLPRPSEDPAADAAALELLALFDRWAWRDEGEAVSAVALRGRNFRAQSVLLTGWLGCALVGGALDWRPMVWMTGESGSGKSTLQKIVSLIMGASLVSSSDATPAGIYQTVGYSSRAAAIDEAESDPQSPKMRNMVALVRQSSSGGEVLRGSADAKRTHSFTARSSFLLSSIIVPPLNSQDLLRIAMLELSRLPEGQKPPLLEAGKLAAIGRRLRRRVLDGWGRFVTTLDSYKAALGRTGHDQRGQEQYGALLAMVDLLLFEGEPDTDTADELAASVGRERLEAAQEMPTNSQGMLRHLISIPLDVFRGGTRMSIGVLVEAACKLLSSPDGGPEPAAARNALIAHGVYVDGAAEKANVTLPNQHAGLAQLFDRTIWRTEPGAVTSGWQQAMKRLAGAVPVNSRKVGGRGWRVPVTVFLRYDEGGE